MKKAVERSKGERYERDENLGMRSNKDVECSES
jgi:hypothetical protein